MHIWKGNAHLLALPPSSPGPASSYFLPSSKIISTDSRGQGHTIYDLWAACGSPEQTHNSLVNETGSKKAKQWVLCLCYVAIHQPACVQSNFLPCEFVVQLIRVHLTNSCLLLESVPSKWLSIKNVSCEPLVCGIRGGEDAAHEKLFTFLQTHYYSVCICYMFREWNIHLCLAC